MIETKHTPDQGKSRLSHMGKRFFSLIEFDQNEELLLEIRKHPFGLLLILLTAGIIATTVLIGTFTIAASSVIGEFELDSGRRYIALFGFILASLIFIVAAIYAQLYRSNVVYVTNEKIAQVLYITLFNRKISQLNIGDVQDVTVSQKGIFAHLFGYGTLVIETAGEQQNYTFTFVPHPHAVAKVIIEAHEVNLKQYGN